MVIAETLPMLSRPMRVVDVPVDPVNLNVPSMCRVCSGFSVPMPTFPEGNVILFAILLFIVYFFLCFWTAKRG